MSIAGIRYDHEEFEGRAKYDFYDPVDVTTGSNQQGRDCQGHGTHVAALAAGKTFGAAKGATLYSTRVLTCNGRGSYSHVLLGLNHVVEQQIARKDRRIIINMSLRGPRSPSLHNAIGQATEEGILVVVAAGNDFTDACRYRVKNLLVHLYYKIIEKGLSGFEFSFYCFDPEHLMCAHTVCVASIYLCMSL